MGWIETSASGGGPDTGISERELVRDRSWRSVAVVITSVVVAGGVGFGLGGVAETASVPAEPASLAASHPVAIQPDGYQSSTVPSQSETDLARALTIAHLRWASEACP